MDCRELVIDWPTDGLPTPDGQLWYPRFTTDSLGAPMLSFRRIGSGAGTEPFFDAVIGYADGPLTFVLRHTGMPGEGCSIITNSFREGRLAIEVTGDGTTSVTTDSLRDALIWAEVGELVPKLAPIVNDDQVTWQWAAGSQRWLNGRGFSAVAYAVFSTDFAEQEDIWPDPADPDQLPAGIFSFIVKDTVFFEVGNLQMFGVMVHDDANGVRPLLRYFGDTWQAAGNLGSDGKDMVWTYGWGKEPGDQAYPSRDIMTAPYTTDATAINATRLRSDPNPGLGTSQFAVGHGFAGHSGAGAGTVIIVRLADGVSWTLSAPATPSKWKWLDVIGFTEDEVFLHVSKPAWTIARVKLASLGSGTPPD